MANEQDQKVRYTFASPVRAGFINVIKARPYKDEHGKEKGDPRFDATFIIEPDSKDFEALKALVIPAAQALHPGKKLVARRLTQEELDSGSCVEISVPWKDGTKQADKAKAKGKDQEFFRGKIALKASSKFAPVLTSVQGGKYVEFLDPATRASLTKLFYSGAKLAPVVTLNAYEASNDKPGGVSLRLEALCFVGDGARIGGVSVNYAEQFKGYVGQPSSVDPGSNDEFSTDPDEL